jgi:hypothetical protein
MMPTIKKNITMLTLFEKKNPRFFSHPSWQTHVQLPAAPLTSAAFEGVSPQ